MEELALEKNIKNRDKVKVGCNLGWGIKQAGKILFRCLMGPEESPYGAMKEYTLVSFANINAVLRGEVKKFCGSNASRIPKMDKYIEACKIQKEMRVFRGTCRKALGQYQNLSTEELVGKTITDKAYMSTSKNYSTAFSFSKGVILVIDAKAGSSICPLTTLSNVPSEREYLIGRDESLQIHKAQMERNTLLLFCTLEANQKPKNHDIEESRTQARNLSFSKKL